MDQADKKPDVDLSLEGLLEAATPVHREDHLEPEASRFTRPASSGMDISLTLAAKLVAPIEREIDALPLLPWHEKASVFCHPTYEAPWALQVVGSRVAGFWALVSELTAQKAEEISFSTSMRCTELSKDLGFSVCHSWRRIVSQTHYAEQRLGGRCDGESYHFAYSGKDTPEMAGQTWSPAKTTVPGRFVALAKALKEYVRDPVNHPAMEAIHDHVAWLTDHALLK